MGQCIRAIDVPDLDSRDHIIVLVGQEIAILRALQEFEVHVQHAPSLAEQPLVEARQIRIAAGTVSIACIGPLTNLALALVMTRPTS